MQKINLTLDVTKIPKDKISSRTFHTKEGDHTAKEVRIVLVELKDEYKKVLTSGSDYDMVKTHFAALQQTKEEREAQVPTVYVGEGIQFISSGESSPAASPEPKDEDPFSDDIPF
jgi:hypothetical protein